MSLHPNEITYTDMSQLFTSGECNGNGSKSVTRGAITSVMSCTCKRCVSGKEARRQAYMEWEKRFNAVRRSRSVSYTHLTLPTMAVV